MTTNEITSKVPKIVVEIIGSRGIIKVNYGNNLKGISIQEALAELQNCPLVDIIYEPMLCRDF